MLATRDEKRAPTVRALAYVSIAASAVIALLVAAALVRTSTQLESATEDMILNAQSWALASEAELAVLMYQRISNLYAATGEPELAVTRAEVAVELQRVLETAENFVSSAAERQLLEEVAIRLEAYYRERTAVEGQDIEIEQLLRMSQPSLDIVVQSLDELHDLNEAQVFQAQSDAMRWNRLSGVFAALAAFVLMSVLLTMAFGLRRYVLRPLLELHETIGQFRSGSMGVRARTEGLHEVRELAQGFNEMADALARQRENQLAFLAGVAHDLRTPLYALRLGIQAIAQEQSNARRDRAHGVLDRQVDRMARMVEDLLDATRIEAGKFDMRIQEFDLRDAVEDMIRLYAPTSPDHRITAELPAEPVLIEGDPLRIEQVVSNLLSNAIKYSPQGGAIGVTVAGTQDDVELCVADEGIGIRPEDQLDIFLPFRRRKTDVAAGAGLGLSVVRRIVEAHGGHIDFNSRAEQGTVFRIMLRRKLAGPGASSAENAEIGAA